MSEFTLSRVTSNDLSEDDNNTRNVDEDEKSTDSMDLIDGSKGEFNLEPTYKSMGLPEQIGDVAIDDAFCFRDETTRGIDFLKPLADIDNPMSHFGESSMMMGVNTTVDLIEQRNYNEPPKLPIDISLFPLEKTHFLTNAKPVDVCTEFRKAFQDNKVEINNFNMSKYKFKCTFNVTEEINNKKVVRESVSFRARIYSINKPDKKYVVELQRREGCCMEWRKLYKNLRESIPLEKIVQ